MRNIVMVFIADLMDDTDEILEVVIKLKKKLSDVLSSGSNKEEDMAKILKKLSLVPMSIDILKTTQIGREVNNLRKWGGKVSSKAKSLVKKWKQLLPDAEETHHHHHHQELASASVYSSEDGGGSRIELRHNESKEIDSPQSLKKKHSHKHSEPVPVDNNGEGDSDPVVSLTEESANSKKQSQHQNRGGTSKKRTSKMSYDDEFTRAMTIPLDNREVFRGRSGAYHDRKHRLRKDKSPGRTEVVGDGERSWRQDPVKVSRERSPGVTLRDTSAGMKRKVTPVEPEVLIGHSKRSRTQVYSGKKTQSGPQVVTSLFDMCMKVLIDNIDVIEEVGPGVPYHVLEPLLLRCTATQLMKLEEFNPHLIEDTDDLWRKHVLKDFKETRKNPGDTWKELYGERLAEREEKLRNLTARIKANKDAREEPVRKVKLAEATMKPSRRSAGSRRGGGFSSGLYLPIERSHHGSQLMKRTMKMAKERSRK